jgi:hypothetical protein
MNALQFYHDYQAGNAHFLMALTILAEVTLFVGAFCALGYFAPLVSNYIFSIPAIIKLLDLAASPVNSIIRPLSAYTGISPHTWSALFGIALAGACYSISAASLMSATAALPYLLVPIVIYNYIALVQLVVNCYKVRPALGIFQGAILLTSICLAAIFPQPVSLDDNISLAGIFLMNLSSASILYYTNRALSNPRAAQVEAIEDLPLPKEPAPQSIQKATLLGNKRATQSHRFFNTPKDADYIEPKARTFSQQCSSFFGGGAIKRNAYIPKAKHQKIRPLALCPA